MKRERKKPRRLCTECKERPARKDSDYCSDACEMDARIDEGEMELIFGLHDDD